VVSGKDHDRLAQPVELSPDERDGLVRSPVVIEEVAGDQHQVDLVRQRAIDDTPEELPAALVVLGLPTGTAAVAVQVHVGSVQNAEGSSGWAHDQQHATFRPARLRMRRRGSD
jgi:hypothetical protein